MSDWRKKEADTIAARVDLTDEQKAYKIKLVMMTREEMNAHSAKRSDLARSLTYTITLSGAELEQLGFAASLNRRMFDRGAEHETFDAAFKLVLEKCALFLNAEWEKVK